MIDYLFRKGAAMKTKRYRRRYNKRVGVLIDNIFIVFGGTTFEFI